MRWINRLETRLGSFAIHGLLRYVAALNALVFVLELIRPGFFRLIDLQPARVLEGEVWRIFTFALVPTSSSFIWVAFAVYCLIFFGDAIESAWGALRTNLFYFTGMLATVLGAFLFDGAPSAIYLNLSLLLAFGTLFPDAPMTFMFFIPMKAKWLAILSIGIVLIAPSGQNSYVAKAVALGNYLLFFGPAMLRNFQTDTQNARRRGKFQAAAKMEDTLHHCKVCDRTENSNPELEFRVAADGEEYCTEHLPARA